MLTYYSGEFLISPIPLEIQLHPCNYGCVYCFATLNYRHSGYAACNVTGLMNLLATFPQKKSLAAYLLQQGYPVLLSNHTDPFCAANAKLIDPIIDTLNDCRIPLTFQTKGGVTAAQLDRIPPSVWCITLTSDNDAVRARIEPHAPSLADRYALIETLIARGHAVCVDVVPYVPEWWTDEVVALERWLDMGVQGVWTEPIHFHYRQRNQMTPAERAAIGEELLTWGMKNVYHWSDIEQFYTFREWVEEVGLEVYTTGQANQSDYFKVYQQYYPKLFPTLQDFVNACHTANRGEFEWITEQDWLAFFAGKFPAGKWSECNSILGSTNHDIFWNAKIPNKLSFQELLSIIFRNPTISHHPGNSKGFAIAAKPDAAGEPATYYADDRGVNVLTFQPHNAWNLYKTFAPADVGFAYLMTHPDEQDDEFKRMVAALQAEIRAERQAA